MNYIDIGPIKTKKTYNKIKAILSESGFIENNLLEKKNKLPRYIFVGCVSYLPCYESFHKEFTPQDLYNKVITPQYKLPSFREKSASVY